MAALALLFESKDQNSQNTNNPERREQKSHAKPSLNPLNCDAKIAS